MKLLHTVAAHWRRLTRRALLKSGQPNAYCELLDGRPFQPLPSAPRVVVLKLDHFGDFVLALPALARLRESLPGAEITLICGSWNAPLAERCGLIDTVIPFDFLPPRNDESNPKAPVAARIEAFKSIAKVLGRIDIAIDLRSVEDTRPLLACLDASFRAGFAEPFEARTPLDIALTITNEAQMDRRRGVPTHARLRLLMLVDQVIAAVQPPRAEAERLLGEPPEWSLAAPYLIIAPGAGADIRCWPIESLARVAKSLSARWGLRVAILGSATEAPLGASLASALAVADTLDLTGVTALADTPAIIANARLFIGMDSGLTHLAGALGVPTICIFSGVTRLERDHLSMERILS